MNDESYLLLFRSEEFLSLFELNLATLKNVHYLGF